jgi:hypothetical protein
MAAIGCFGAGNVSEPSGRRPALIEKRGGGLTR